MNNFTFFILLIISISQDFLLLNEESLILICFISFCFVLKENLGSSIQSTFYSKILLLEQNFFLSFEQLLKTFEKIYTFQLNDQKLIHNFLILKNYYLFLNLKIINKIPNYQEVHKQILFLKKLQYSSSIEQQFNRLLLLLLVHKLKKICLNSLFCRKKLFLSDFFCFNKIILREYLEFI